MPDGHVQWIDTKNDVAHIVRRGREFLAPLSEIESRARVTGARVHFDIVRSNGVESAGNVSLAAGTRTNKRQRRFGDLTGARQPGAKIATTSASRLGVDVTTQPMRVIQTWLESILNGDVDDALSLYSPDAVVNTPSRSIRGRMHLRAFLHDEGVTGPIPAEVTLIGEDQLVRIDWPASAKLPRDATEQSSWFEVDHGHIVEHWQCTSPHHDDYADSEHTPIEFVVRGAVPSHEIENARRRMEKVCNDAHMPVTFARMKISVIDHGGSQPVSASATIDLDGAILRAHVGAQMISDATDRLCSRLRRQIDRVEDREKHRKTDAPVDLTTDRPQFIERPTEDRALVRHKSYTPGSSTVEEALWDMQLLDYDFFLFSELHTGEDHLLAEVEGRVMLYSLSGGGPESAESIVDDVVEVKAPTLRVAEAIDRLDGGRERMVFFRNASSDRGNVAYRRFDGHYGLITPT